MQNHDDTQKDKRSGVSFTELAAEQTGDPSGGGNKADVQFSRMGAGSKAGTDLEESDEVGKSRMLYERARDYVSRAYDAAREGDHFSLDEGIAVVDEVVAGIVRQNLLFAMALHTDEAERYLYNHPVNVAILAVFLGRNLGFEQQQLLELGLAALLHDIGSVRVPDNILNKPSALTDKERESIKQRPNHSFNILQGFKDHHPYLAETAVQVYERTDGSGYPMGLQKDEIDEYAQVIGLVDVYEALTHTRPHRPRFLYLPAVKEIIHNYKNSFQHRHLKALLNSFSIFPVYSYVRLNSGAIGRVLETYPGQPLRPKLQVIYDSQERRVLTERIIDLTDNPLLYIVDSVGDDEIKRSSGRGA